MSDTLRRLIEALANPRASLEEMEAPYRAQLDRARERNRCTYPQADIPDLTRAA